MRGFDVLDPTLDLKRNYFIEASAGTGKTFTIENTVVRLIQEGIPIDQILVVTFTRAATLELKTRIRRNLEEKKLKRELSEFEEAKIFTIHGFCFHTLKEHALETGFSLNQAEESASQDTFKRIFKDFLRTELLDLHPKQLERMLKTHQGDVEKLFKEVIKPSVGEGRSFAELQKGIEEEVHQLVLDPHLLLEELLLHAPKFGKMCDRKKQLKPEIAEGLGRFVQLFASTEKKQDKQDEQDEQDKKINKLNLSCPSCFFSEGITGDLPILKMVPDNLLQNKGPYPPLLQQMNQRLIPLLAELANPQTALNQLKGNFKQFFSHVCQEEDLFFYDDLLTAMQKCVRETEFAQKVRKSYQAVLIDEFQDTDRIQWEIFSTLFFGHLPLYLVGDPKQSIYRFRGADLYTYMEAKEAMGSEALTSLTRNYRAQPTLVEALNSLFSRVPNLITLPKTGQTLPVPLIEAALSETSSGKIIFCQAPDEGALFSFIVHEIERLHREEGVAYKECAILVKDHYQAKRFCAQCPLPFAPKRSGSLLDAEAFPILEDLLLAAYNPRERHCVARVIGGPLFGIPLERLKESLEEKIGLFCSYHRLLLEEGILPLFRAVVQSASFQDESLYLDLLQLVELIAENAGSFEEYLPFLQKLKQEDSESERLKARAKCGSDAIQVMTTHVSKGLEYSIVFPIGLMSPQDMQEEEDLSEKMRQLYVALTRAKKRLYLPVTEKENTPIHTFLSQVLKGESLDSFVQNTPHFEKVSCEKMSTDTLKGPIMTQKSPLVHKQASLFSPSSIYSYSSLSEKREQETFLKIPEGTMPAGADTGTLLHKIFEKLDFKAKEIRPFLVEQLRGTHLENWLEAVENLVHNALHFPLPHPSGPFCLVDVNPRKIKHELEFLYPSEEPVGYIKGFIDLFFEHKGRYYIIDWKSNFLENYAPENLREAVLSHNYDLQIELYRKAALRYLSLFNAEDQFEGVFYFFLRGLDISNPAGVYKG